VVHVGLSSSRFSLKRKANNEGKPRECKINHADMNEKYNTNANRIMHLKIFKIYKGVASVTNERSTSEKMCTPLQSFT